MQGIVLIIAMAVTVEAVVEYAKTIGKAFLNDGWKTAVTQITAAVLGVVICFMSNADLFATIGISFVSPWVGNILTGIIISRGANYVSDFIHRLNK